MPPLDPVRFLAAMAELPAGVTVTTCRDGLGAPVGATLSAVTSLSLDPPMVLACFDRGSNTLKAVIEPGSPFLLHILAHGQGAIALALPAQLIAGKVHLHSHRHLFVVEALQLPNELRIGTEFLKGCDQVI